MALEQGTSTAADTAGRGPLPAEESVRGFASASVRRAAWACWVRAAMPIGDLFGDAARTVPELLRSGARWGGAGVLQDHGSEWYGFEGRQGSLLVFAFDASTLPAVEVRRMGLLRTMLERSECRLSERGQVPPSIAPAVRASRVVPVWELPGLAHLAPEAASLEGFATLAA